MEIYTRNGSFSTFNVKHFFYATFPGKILNLLIEIKLQIKPIIENTIDQILKGWKKTHKFLLYLDLRLQPLELRLHRNANMSKNDNISQNQLTHMP